MNVRATLAAAAIALAVTLVGCSHARAPQPAPSSGAALYDASALPHGKMGALIRDGYNIITQTHKYAKPYVVSQMECSSCHIAGGIVPRGGWLAVYGTFPQYSPRAKRAITLQDRIAECFLYSMNGKPPAYTSHTMIAMVAYMAWISRGQRVFAKPSALMRIAKIKAPSLPSVARGAVIYAQQCSMCHQVSGAGIPGEFPALWGATSFNKGAGMAKQGMMAGFVRYNMPLGRAGTLSDQQAVDVAAYVESHSRPSFNKTAIVSFPAKPAAFF